MSLCFSTHTNLDQHEPQLSSIQGLILLQGLNMSWIQKETIKGHELCFLKAWVSQYDLIEGRLWLLWGSAQHALLLHKFMGKFHFSKTAQEVTADTILFVSSSQPVPLRHHFPFLEMWPCFHFIYIFCLSGFCLSSWFLLQPVGSLQILAYSELRKQGR